MTNTSTKPTSEFGGSAAAQAYREEMTRKGQVLPAMPTANAPLAKAGKEARAAVRKSVSGRARVVFPGGSARSGKLVDMSEHGACILMDDSLPPKTGCTLECNIFLNGKLVGFNTSAVSVYSVLAGRMGFKVGFQWGALDANNAQAIQSLLRAP